MSTSEAAHPKRLNILVFGPTGAGKSTIINLLTNNSAKLEVGHSLASCTNRVDVASISYKGHEINFLDTPGFDDSRMKPAEHLLKIGGYLADKYENEERHKPHIHGVLYIHRITDNRMTGSGLTNLRVFRRIIGSHVFQNLVIVTNRWSDPPNPDHEMFEQELRDTPEYFGTMVNAGARMGPPYRILENSTCGQAQQVLLDLFMGYEANITQIQMDLVDKAQHIGETAAGRLVGEDLELLRREKEIEIQGLHTEIAALNKGHEQDRAEMEKEILALREVMRLIEVQKKFLQINYAVCRHIAGLVREGKEWASTKVNSRWMQFFRTILGAVLLATGVLVPGEGDDVVEMIEMMFKK